jgi:hypothetical protein
MTEKYTGYRKFGFIVLRELRALLHLVWNPGIKVK